MFVSILAMNMQTVYVRAEDFCLRLVDLLLDVIVCKEVIPPPIISKFVAVNEIDRCLLLFSVFWNCHLPGLELANSLVNLFDSKPVIQFE